MKAHLHAWRCWRYTPRPPGRIRLGVELLRRRGLVRPPPLRVWLFRPRIDNPGSSRLGARKALEPIGDRTR